MRLTKLTLHGFKSFADQTEMLFEPGATMIVGPNGCGKSNVSDAVRWVLGEQRARMMRGAKMEEVIFQGSSARRAVNVAEVSLHFDNTDGVLPVAFKEVVITRRLSRSGESDYFLNRAPCRLRDIHDLVRGTGLGADSGVVIESKMIDALLSDRPDDRRELFEEAAGVGLYRDRRRSTERRLEETTVDLSRLDDLIEEVQSQVRSLARQRKKAERNVELTQRRFLVDVTLAARELEGWADELVQLEARLEELREAVPAAATNAESATRDREAAQRARAAAEAMRAELARMSQVQREQANQVERELRVAEERQRNAMSRRERADAELLDGEALGQRVVAEREDAETERQRLQVELAAAVALLTERAGAEEEARRSVSVARQQVEAAEKTLRDARDQVRRLELDREGTERELAEVLSREGALGSEIATLADALASVERDSAAADEALEIARVTVARAQAALEAARTGAQAARSAEADVRTRLGDADRQRTSLQGRIHGLEALDRDRVGLAPGAASVLRERERFGPGAVLGPLSDFLSAESDAAILVERYLGATVHAVVVRDREAAAAVAEWHAGARPGPVLLLPLDAVHDSADAAGSLALRVQAAAPAQRWVHALLGQVTPLGAGTGFVDPRGAIYLPGGESAQGPIQRRAEMAMLRDDLETLDAARARISAEAVTVSETLQAAEAAVMAAADAASQAQGEVRRAEEARAEVERRAARAQRERNEAQGLSEKLSDRRAALQARAADDDARAEELRAGLAGHEAVITSARERLSGADEMLEETREGRTIAQVAHAQAQARVQVAQDRASRLLQEQATATARLETLRNELMQLANADEALANQIATLTVQLDERQLALSEVDTRLIEAEEGLRAADVALQRGDEALEAVRRHAVLLAEELHQAELRHTQLEARRQNIRERLETEWRKPIAELLEGFEPLELEADALRTENEALRQQLEQLGPVNPLAVEEHEEEQKRFDFLTAQRNDLAEAKLSLLQAIKEIDATARELFLATFAKVRENFRQIFQTLFGGGECDLKLENPDQPLDCDIEIHASPRGKKTQRIHLLSSGERALVALSLLFGIFLTRPSPFCLLDEVDAPLDDQNVGRYVKMLNEFKERTQFIVITHNPRTTTEAADAVYGVTMQEPGVSSLVSVRLRNRNGDAVQNGGVDPDPNTLEVPDAANESVAAAV
ncbi:MAG: chromosome segregation protein SMC [Gemmatimonadaceae bacterium]|nr:chromosome segregation protein SMC [Gemmatimonadaceae bacterium]